MLAPALNCIIGQRLVRTLSDDTQSLQITPQIQSEIDRELVSIKQHNPQLLDTTMQVRDPSTSEDPYHGRTAITEVLTVDDTIEAMIVAQHSAQDILAAVQPL
jgi:type II secretory ATPase GspE/PulE/Tfp pilus assembly ATPase PilB-like protein